MWSNCTKKQQPPATVVAAAVVVFVDWRKVEKPHKEITIHAIHKLHSHKTRINLPFLFSSFSSPSFFLFRCITMFGFSFRVLCVVIFSPDAVIDVVQVVRSVCIYIPFFSFCLFSFFFLFLSVSHPLGVCVCVFVCGVSFSSLCCFSFLSIVTSLLLVLFFFFCSFRCLRSVW